MLFQANADYLQLSKYLKDIHSMKLLKFTQKILAFPNTNKYQMVPPPLAEGWCVQCHSG